MTKKNITGTILQAAKWRRALHQDGNRSIEPVTRSMALLIGCLSIERASEGGYAKDSTSL
jgi:hypothetical protein